MRRVLVALGVRKLAVLAVDTRDAEAFCGLASAFVPCEFHVHWARNAWEVDAAMRLRRAVFCAEQGIFVGDDCDAIDPHAQLIVAVSHVGGMPDQVVGTVRIHQAAGGVWWGSRLAVHPSFRKHGHLGATLIRIAVESAHARGCDVFLAHVQEQNVPLFEKLHWQPLTVETLHGRLHRRMQADLAFYPPMVDPLVGTIARASRSR